MEEQREMGSAECFSFVEMLEQLLHGENLAENEVIVVRTAWIHCSEYLEMVGKVVSYLDLCIREKLRQLL